MIPITKPSLDISDLRYIKNVIKSKILTDGYYQKKTEALIKKLIKCKCPTIEILPWILGFT